MRELENPTPRWTTCDGASQGFERPDNVPAEIQDRAHTFPIWYTSGEYLAGAREFDGLVDLGALQRTLLDQIFNVDDAPTAMALDDQRFRISPERAKGEWLVARLMGRPSDSTVSE